MQPVKVLLQLDYDERTITSSAHLDFSYSASAHISFNFASIKDEKSYTAEGLADRSGNPFFVTAFFYKFRLEKQKKIVTDSRWKCSQQYFRTEPQANNIVIFLSSVFPARK